MAARLREDRDLVCGCEFNLDGNQLLFSMGEIVENLR